jgi:hypothetical protein
MFCWEWHLLLWHLLLLFSLLGALGQVLGPDVGKPGVGILAYGYKRWRVKEGSCEREIFPILLFDIFEFISETDLFGKYVCN